MVNLCLIRNSFRVAIFFALFLTASMSTYAQSFEATEMLKRRLFRSTTDTIRVQQVTPTSSSIFHGPEFDSVKNVTAQLNDLDSLHRRLVSRIDSIIQLVGPQTELYKYLDSLKRPLDSLKHDGFRDLNVPYESRLNVRIGFEFPVLKKAKRMKKKML